MDEEKTLKKSKFEEQQKKNKADAKKFAVGIELQVSKYTEKNFVILICQESLP